MKKLLIALVALVTLAARAQTTEVRFDRASDTAAESTVAVTVTVYRTSTAQNLFGELQLGGTATPRLDYRFENASAAALLNSVANPAPAASDTFAADAAAVGSRYAVVTAPYDDNGATDAGTVYFYELTNQTTVLRATVANPAPTAYDYFGSAVAGFGSNAFVIAARDDDAGAANAGSVYVYEWNGSAVQLKASIANPTPVASDEFGSAVVGLASNFFVVGDSYDTTVSAYGGALYLYEWTGSIAVLRQTIANPSLPNQLFFGRTLAAMDTNLFLVGGLDNAGADLVHLYAWNGTAAILQTIVTNPTPASQDRFGQEITAVASNRFLVSADWDSTGAFQAGAAYLYEWNGTSAVLLATVLNPSPGYADRFGTSLAGVGSNRFLVGAGGDGSGVTNTGCAYLYEWTGTSVVYVAAVTNPAPFLADYFGSCAAAVGEGQVLVGASQDDQGASNAGSAYLYGLTYGANRVAFALTGSATSLPLGIALNQDGLAEGDESLTLSVANLRYGTQGTPNTFALTILSSTGVTFDADRVADNYFGTGADGDVYVNSIQQLPVAVDGEMIVKNYESLHIGPSGLLTPANRNRGMLLYVRGDLTVEGEISMTARGASGNPDTFGVSADGIRIVRRAPGGIDYQVRSDLQGAGTDAVAAEAQQYPVLSENRVFRVARQGASGGAGVTSGSGNASGNPGASGPNLTGGGGSGGGRNSGSTSGSGSYGSPFTGGSGGSANYTAQGAGNPALPWGGAGGNAPYNGSGYDRSIGGGAGNPGGQGLIASGLTSSAPYVGTNGTGGLLILVVQGNVTVAAGGRITANGSQGGVGTLTYERSGGASGGGAILLLYAGGLTNVGIIQAVGGTNFANTSAGGAGGDGWVDVGRIYPSMITHEVSGRVTDATTGAGVPGVQLKFSGAGSTVTGPDGRFTNNVYDGWSGSVTPSYACGTFAPARRDYVDVTESQAGQDFAVQGVVPPGDFTLASPANGGVARAVANLRWNASVCAAAYDVYVGCDGAPVWQATVTTNAWSLPIATNGVYAWYVVARNSIGSNRAPASGTWSFNGYSSIIPDGWVMRMPVVVSNSTAAALEEYPVRLSVNYEKDMRSDFANLRFRDASGTNALPYWVESYQAGSNVAVWVRVPYVPPMGVATAYLCYGTAETTSASDGDATFTFFDDFSGTSLKDGWTFWNPAGDDAYSLTERPGWMRLKVSSNSDAWQAVNTAPFVYMSLPAATNYVIQTRADASTIGANKMQMLTWIRSFATGYANKGELGAHTSPTAVRYEADGYSGSSITAASTMHYLRYRKVGTTVNYDYSADGATWTSFGSHDPGSAPDYWGLGGKSWSSSTLNADYDYFIVRKNAGTDPTVRVDAPVLASARKYNVAGRVTQQETGRGLDDITVAVSGAAPVLTADGGYYTAPVWIGASGTITPSYVCGSFAPSALAYAEITNDLSAQDFALQGLTPPSAFALQSPADASIVRAKARLTWEPASCAAVYDVFVGVNGEPVLRATVTTNEWLLPITTNGSYAWFVVARNAGGTARSPADGWWTFLGDTQESWNYRRAITLNPATSVTGYQVRITLTAATFDYARAHPLGLDLRFTQADGSVLPHWIETWATNGTSAVWVQVRDAGVSTLYVNYGRADADDTGSGDATFEFFDDFAGSAIATSRWTITDSSGWSVGGGVLQGANSSGRLTSRRTFEGGFAMVAKARTAVVAANGQMLGGFYLNNGNCAGLLIHPGTMYNRLDGTWNSIVAPVTGVDFVHTVAARTDGRVDMKIVYASSGAVYYEGVNLANTVSGEPIALGRRFDDGSSYLNQSYDTTWDWVLARKYVATEPVASVGPLQISVAGRLTDAVTGAGVAGVRLTLSGGGSVVTRADGWYECFVSTGWSGSVIPPDLCGTFAPAQRSYLNVTTLQERQDFTVQGLQAPLAFALESPGSGEVARVTMTLRWAASSCASTYDVYVGREGAPVWQATVTTNSWSQSIVTNGLYTWYVVARNAAGATRAPASGTWSFRGYESLIPEGWVMRRPVVISNATAVALESFPVRLSVNFEREMRSDFANIRFRDERCSARLPYWVESLQAGSNAVVWVRIPSIPASGVTTSYLCFGSAETVSASDGDATFTFFDDFSGSTLKSGWTLWNPGGDDGYTLVERPGWMRLKITAGSDAWQTVNTAPFLYITLPSASNYVIQARVDESAVVGSTHQILAWLRNFATGSGNKGYFGAYGSPTAVRYESDGYTGSSVTMTSPVHYLRYRKVDGTVYYDSSGEGATWTSVGSHVPASVPDYWGLGGKAWGSSALNADYDYYFVRKYAAAEPAARIDAAELFADERYAVAGQITQQETGRGLDDVTLNVSGADTALTAGGGYYTAWVGRGWSGTVTPAHVCSTFTPASRLYVEVTNDHAGQAYSLQGLTLPGALSLQLPTDGSVVYGDAALRWTAASCAAWYDVYAGREGEPALIARATTNAWTHVLQEQGTYDWFVVARNALGSSRAPASGTWRFVGYPSVTVAGNLTLAAGDTTYDHKVLVKQGGTLTVVGPHTFAGLILTNGAVLTHPAATTNAAYGLDLTVLGPLYVSSDSAIDVSARGYPAGRTESNRLHGASGGSYGGLGSDWTRGSNVLYGDVRQPNEPGSGGSSGVGGGSAHLRAGTLTLEGVLTANGGNAANGGYGGGGSGGGVWLDVDLLSGSGKIEARGGSRSTYGGAGGGGGRVALYYGAVQGFDTTGRIDVTSSGTSPGSPGTIYLQPDGGVGEWVLDSRGVASAVPSVLWLRDGSIYGDAITLRGSNLNAEAWRANLAPTQLILRSGTRLTFRENATSLLERLELAVSGLLQIEAGAAIDVSGKGYPRTYTRGYLTVGASTGNAGGSHGGRGGDAAGLANAVYGDLRNPNDYGSGAGPSATGGAGGGVIRLTARELRLDGFLRANGAGGTGYGGAGGAGGSIYLDTLLLSGTGTVSASGGAGLSNNDGGGGGGRIAVYAAAVSGFSIATDLRAEVGSVGGGAGHSGESGTIYVSNNVASVMVLNTIPAGGTPGPVTDLVITVGNPLCANSLGLDDLSLTGPSGSVPLSSIEQSSFVTYRVGLAAPQTSPGNYWLRIGTNVESILGGRPAGTLTNGFYIDTSPPPAPSVTNYLAAPVTNGLRTTAVVLRGVVEKDATVWRDGTQLTLPGATSWQAALTLTQGLNAVSLYAVDSAGLLSPTATWTFLVDTVAPSVAAVTPANGAVLNVRPDAVRLVCVEGTSGIDLPHSSFVVKRGVVQVPGAVSIDLTNLVFTPAGAFLNGSFSVAAAVVDNVGNTGTFSSAFAIDTVPPGTPVVEPVMSPTTIQLLTLRGTVWDAGDLVRVFRDDALLTTLNQPAWSYAVTLNQGSNVFRFVARDAAGNESLPTNVVVVFDDILPGPVTVTGNVHGTGTDLALGWEDYDEIANGADIANYEVYRSGQSFVRVADAARIAVQPAGKKYYRDTGLSRGSTYYYAVMARDRGGLALSNVTAVALAPADATPPANPSSASFACGYADLILNWSPPGDSDGDLAGFRVYVTNEVAGANVPYEPGPRTYARGGLAPSSKYRFRVTSYDHTGNESAGLVVTGYTLLPNPSPVLVTPQDSYAQLSWPVVAPTANVMRYDLYASTSVFSSVTGLIARATGTGTTGVVAGLLNSVTTYFAVVTVNASAGFDAEVNPVTAVPQSDLTGPELVKLTWNGLALGAAVTAPGRFGAQLRDPSGVSRVEFLVPGASLSVESSGTTNYTAFWNVAATSADGSHEIEVRATDSRGNTMSFVTNVQVQLAAPPAPVVTTPVGTSRVTRTYQQVAGTGALYAASATWQVNGAAVATSVVSAAGNFSATLDLLDGSNVIRAAAINRAGVGALSAAATVVRDGSLPPPPLNVSASAQADGVIRVTWSAPPGVQVRGYDLYRARSSFTNLASATRLNSSLVGATTYSDATSEDRDYYYRLIVVNDVGSTSEPSAQAVARADRLAPHLLVVAYGSEGPSIPGEERYGPGRLRLLLTMSEALQTTPFFSLTPFNGTPQPVALTRLDDVNYEGAFVISSNTPCGFAQALFSARDTAGNRGTVIDEGAQVTLDACGPALVALQVSPGEPIRNSAAQAVTVTVVAAYQPNDVPAQTPSLQWNLTSTHAGRADIPLTPLTAGSWWGQFVLPADAGVPVEQVQLFHAAVDDLGNLSTDIMGAHRFQVYQGALPPLLFPAGLKAVAGPGGRVQLSWQAVEGASGYAVFRGALPAPLAFVANSGSGPAFEEQRGDSTNWYAVASIRTANGQSVTGAPCEAVSVVADATPPAAASNLVLKLYGNGLGITWEGPTGDGIRYALYRDPYDFDSIEWLAPMTTNIPSNVAADYRPAVGSAYYAVVAADPAGNQSPVSPRAYTNLALLPVNSLRVWKSEAAYPVVSWSHGNASGIDRYHLYLGASGEEWLVTSDLTRYSTSYLDTGFTTGERRYTVSAVDDQGTNRIESLPRSLGLPDLRVTPRTNLVLRGIMNGLVYDVDNLGTQGMTGARLKVVLGGRVHGSEPFDVPAGGAAVTRVVVGGYTNLPNPTVVTNLLSMEPHPDESITLLTRQPITVGNGMMVADVRNDELIRGAVANVRFSLQNTSEENVEIVLATGSGQSASPDVRLKLIDEESGVVLAQVAPRQALGLSVVTLANGQTVARIAPGDTFLSGDLPLTVPPETAANVLLKLEIDRLHYRLGDAEHVEISGLQQTRALSLSDTPYYAEVTNVTPPVSFAATNFLLQGWAVRRSDRSPMANAAVTLVVAHEGFERTYALFTDDAGQWSQSFRAADDETGRFTAWAVHPSVVAKPVQAEFYLSRVRVAPTAVQMDLPYDHVQDVYVEVTPTRGAVLTNVHFAVVTADQPGATWPTGLSVVYTARVATVVGGQTARLPLSLRGDVSAVSTGRVVLRLVSDGGPASGWGTLTVGYTFHLASPVLQWTPNYVDVGVAISNQASAEVTLSNAGYSPLTGLQLSLLTPQGLPAPRWVRLNTASDLGALEAGARRDVSVIFAPTNGVSLEAHAFVLRVESENHSTVDINLFATVDASGLGHALLHVMDIYTGTFNAQGQPVQGLAGAKVRLEKEEGTSLVRELATDAHGEAWFRDLPVGSYLLRVTAGSHESYGGRLWITPASTVSREVFLANTLVTVEWSVVPITIEDRYEVVLTATFETDVPAAVVTVTPPSVSLPESMAAGDVFQGELSIQNQGLLRADQLAFEPPTGDDSLRVEWGRPIPTSLAAGEVVRVPYRVIHVGAAVATAVTGSSTQDPCLVWSKGLRSVCSDVRYGFECVNGRWTQSKYNWCLVASQAGWVRKADCGGAVSGPADPFVINVGSSSSVAPSGAPPMRSLPVGGGSLGCAPRCDPKDPCCTKLELQP